MKKDYFAGKTAVITGGASGIGLALGQTLAERGALVVLADLNRGALEVASASFPPSQKVRTAWVDVRDPHQVQGLMEGTFRDLGRLDLVVNNAGISVDGEFQDLSLEHWKGVMEVNFWGVLYGCRAAYPLMIRQGGGQIVNTASLAGLIPGGLTSVYSASKHGVVGLSLSLRSEARLYGIRVNALCPGYIQTPIHGSTPLVTEYLRSEKNRKKAAAMKVPDAVDCAPAMVRGIERDKGIIFVPNTQRPYWWLHRLNPELIPRFFTGIIRSLKS